MIFPRFYQHFWMIHPDSMCFSPCFPAETALLPSLAPAPRCSEAPGAPPRVPSPGAMGVVSTRWKTRFKFGLGWLGGFLIFLSLEKFSQNPPENLEEWLTMICLWSFSVNLCARVLWVSLGIAGSWWSKLGSPRISSQLGMASCVHCAYEKLIYIYISFN